ncbi:hypothetical protein RJW59_00720 [Buchnera aphidicola (Formosaphis micheliae)]|uniref:TerC family protein n=1 Tax=Buchnera aphidicola TaxID=9 RepID=UPI0031CC5986
MLLSFFSAYFFEQLLSIDNIFVWFILFKSFSISFIWQRKVLIYGVLGAILFRTSMILIGNWLLIKLHWVLYFFGVILILTGAKVFFSRNNENDILKEKKWIIWIYKKLRIINEIQGDKFFLRRNGIFFLTPLCFVAILIELSDIIFSIDSLIAVLSITVDPFVAITSNLLAIFSLRSLYFVLYSCIKKIDFIKYVVGLILIIIGLKIFI